MKQQEARRKEREAEAEAARLLQEASPAAETIPENHLVVARLSKDEMKNPKLKDILGPLKGVINAALPLVEVPPLHEVRNALIFEFPYACDVIDFALADLVGRPTIRLRPLLLVGDPGGGKSRFARRLGELLGLSVWREDASRADGAVFGGTDRRWYSAEPCHPFLAVAQGKIANPLVLIDEMEKAGTRDGLRPPMGLPARLPRARNQRSLSRSRTADHARSVAGLLHRDRQQPRSAALAYPRPVSHRGVPEACRGRSRCAFAGRDCRPRQGTRPRPELGAAARRPRAHRCRAALARRVGAPPAPHRRGDPARARYPRDAKLTIGVVVQSRACPSWVAYPCNFMDNAELLSKCRGFSRTRSSRARSKPYIFFGRLIPWRPLP